MEPHLSCVEPPSEVGEAILESNRCSTKKCNSEDELENNNVYDNGKEDLVTTCGEEDATNHREDQKDDETNVNSSLQAQCDRLSNNATIDSCEIDDGTTCSDDVAVEDHEDKERQRSVEDVVESHENDIKTSPLDDAAVSHESYEKQTGPEDVATEDREGDEGQTCSEDVATEDHEGDEGQTGSEDVATEDHEGDEGQTCTEDNVDKNHENDEDKICSEDDIAEVNEQIDIRDLKSSSSDSNTNEDSQTVEKDCTAVCKQDEPLETGSLSEQVASEEKDNESISNEYLSVPSTNISSESTENDNEVESKFESYKIPSPIVVDLGFEKQNASSDVVNKEHSGIKDESPFDDPDRSDSFDDKISLCSDDEVQLKESDSQERKETPASRAEQVAADRDRKNPAYIPRTGKFFMHDEREGEDITLEEFESCWFEKKRQEQEQLERKKGRIRYGFNGDRWGNDKFDERQQCPKSYDQIVSEYGYDIREDGQANRKKYWDGSYKYGNREDNKERKRRPRGSNEGGMRGRRSGGRGRSNQGPGPGNRSGPGYRPPTNPTYDREPEQRYTEDVDRVGHPCSNSDRDTGNGERLTGRDPQPNDVHVNGRGNRPRTSDPKNYRREFRGKADRPGEKDRQNRNGEEFVTANEKSPNTNAPATSPSAYPSQSTASVRSIQSDTSASFPESAPPASVVFVHVGAPDSYSKNLAAKSSDANISKAPARPTVSMKEEPKPVPQPQTAVDNSANNNAKAPSALGHPSNKRYSAQRRERRFDREAVPSNSRRHQQPRQQGPISNQASHAHHSSQIHDSHNQSKNLQHMSKLQQQRPSQQLPPQSPDSQPQQQPLPMPQMPPQQVGPLPPQVNYQSMHGGLEYPPHASVIPSMPPQQELTYFGPPPASVHPQYLLNYFRAIPADPNLQFYAQQQAAAAAAAAALVNGQFSPNAPPAAPENTGGTVFYPPLAQQQPQPPQLTPERPRRALPIVAPSAGSES